ncbi:hypothetical protein B0J18DRAFT_303745 [Chaetomium sp. MPI-SDFR-AT-0129]|nr:hypothetical protein B0J18DRAFT_303745 [Chaetomium sp. MPI-SDFR-AT-0129]
MPSIPVEILESIFSWRAPPPEDRCYKPARSFPSHHPEQMRFRDDCKSIRLSCKVFSVLRTPSAALFHDLTIFATRQSLSNFQALSQHQVLRNYVHRLIFCCPRSREQEQFLDDEKHRETYRSYVSQFPNLSSVFISNSIPGVLNLDIQPDTHCRDHRLIWQQEAHEIRTMNHHTTFGFQTLAAANVCLQELVTYDWGPTWDFSWESIPGCFQRLNFCRLTRLDLFLPEGTQSAARVADWSTVLLPLLAQLPALAELYLRFLGRNVPHATVSGIWELHLPQLAVLSLQNAGLFRTTFCGFLDRHVHLRELTLISMAETDGLWYSVFTSIRNHPRLKDLELFGLNKKLVNESISTSHHQSDMSSERILEASVYSPGKGEWLDVRTNELYKYLHGEGEWTDGLSSYWE